MRGRILSHRGFWQSPLEKNSLEAFKRALGDGYGIETDIRDLDGELVISHDPPTKGNAPLPLDGFLELYATCASQAWLALNIKSDGLASRLSSALDRHGVKNAFVFDMSVPDMRGYLAQKTLTFTRRSDVETSPSYYPQSQGVWLDCFDIPYSPSHWVTDALNNGKYAALVSPELHSRAHAPAWSDWRKAFDVAENDLVMICTDVPDAALEFFQGSK